MKYESNYISFVKRKQFKLNVGFIIFPGDDGKEQRCFKKEFIINTVFFLQTTIESQMMIILHLKNENIFIAEQNYHSIFFSTC